MLEEWVGYDQETDEEHDKDCVEEGFQMARGNIRQVMRGTR